MCLIEKDRRKDKVIKASYTPDQMIRTKSALKRNNRSREGHGILKNNPIIESGVSV